MPDEFQAFADESDEIIDQIKPLLAEKDPAVVNMVLADLLAMLLASHQTARNADRPILKRFRERILTNHLAVVRALVDAYDEARAESLH